MKEQGEIEFQGDTPIPIGSRSAWISIHWDDHGAERSHDFSNVQELARFLMDKPELGKIFGYPRVPCPRTSEAQHETGARGYG